jgi:hypothetical protein
MFLGSGRRWRSCGVVQPIWRRTRGVTSGSDMAAAPCNATDLGRCTMQRGLDGGRTGVHHVS